MGMPSPALPCASSLLDRGVDIDALAARLGRETIAREDVLGGCTGGAGGSGERPIGTWITGEWGPVTVEPLNRMAQVGGCENLAAAQAQLIPAVTHHDSADMTAGSKPPAKAAQGRRARGMTALAFHVAVLARCLKDCSRASTPLCPPDGKSLDPERTMSTSALPSTRRGASSCRASPRRRC